MKKFLYYAFMAFVMVGMTACEKDPVDNTDNGGNGGNGGNTNNGPLVGTEWVYSETESETEDGVTYDFVLSITLRYTTNADGKMVLASEVSVGGVPMGDAYEEEVPFTYTYEGTATQGSGDMTSIDEETNLPSTIPFSINGNELTMVDEDEDGQPMEIVFIRK